LRFGRILEKYDVFVCPTVATTEVPVTMKPWEDMRINGKRVTRWVSTLVFSMFRCCPALTVPSGLANNGVPSGIQLVGRKFDDPTVFRLAAAIERERPIATMAPCRSH